MPEGQLEKKDEIKQNRNKQTSAILLHSNSIPFA